MSNTCTDCNGTGVGSIDQVQCPTCGGHGLEKFYQPGYGEAVRRCTTCNASGTVTRVTVCPACNGMGRR